jgi:hypothetical protein
VGAGAEFVAVGARMVMSGVARSVAGMRLRRRVRRSRVLAHKVLDIASSRAILASTARKALVMALLEWERRTNSLAARSPSWSQYPELELESEIAS